VRFADAVPRVLVGILSTLRVKPFVEIGGIYSEIGAQVHDAPRVNPTKMVRANAEADCPFFHRQTFDRSDKRALNVHLSYSFSARFSRGYDCSLHPNHCLGTESEMVGNGRKGWGMHMHVVEVDSRPAKTDSSTRSKTPDSPKERGIRGAQTNPNSHTQAR